MELFGIKIRIHPSFFWLLLIMLVFSGPSMVVSLLIIFGFVVLHELSHSLVARAHGIAVHDITLLPIGGVARLGEMPENPGTEFRIAIAGPMLNFVVVGIMLLLDHYRIFQIHNGLAHFILIANLGLGIFNLLPAFPMDGGRLLRALLARKRGYLAATHIAASVGRWIAFVLFAIAVAGMLMRRWNLLGLLLIAAFIYMSGKQEELAVAFRHANRGLWQYFGVSQEPPAQVKRTDVIDVEGKVRPADTTEAADAFKALGDKGRSHIE